MNPVKVDVVPGAAAVNAYAYRGGAARATHDWVAEETPIALQYNGISHAVMLGSPLHLDDFAVGFSLSEGVVDAVGDIRSIELQDSPYGLVLEIHILAMYEARLKQRRRTLAGKTGCGLCGVESLEVALPELGDNIIQPLPIQASAVSKAMSRLREKQDLSNVTGAAHAAGWCSLEGELLVVREDVGRHNALDKLIGALARAEVDVRTGFVIVTSRASYEMVQKAAHAGIALLAAVSAPTALAIKTADRVGMSLLGFTRDRDWVAYCHADRLILEHSE